MHPNAQCRFTAAMEVDADKEALFNEVCDSKHVPNLLKVLRASCAAPRAWH